MGDLACKDVAMHACVWRAEPGGTYDLQMKGQRVVRRSEMVLWPCMTWMSTGPHLASHCCSVASASRVAAIPDTRDFSCVRSIPNRPACTHTQSTWRLG